MSEHAVERVNEIFTAISGNFLREAERKLELARAANDEEARVTEHIKIQVMMVARQLLDVACQRALKEVKHGGG